MADFLHAVASVTIILMLTATGWLCGRKGWMTAQSKTFLSKFLLSLAVPCMSIYGLRNNLTRELLGDSLGLLAVPYISIALNFILSYLLARLLRLPKKRRGVFMVMCSLSNSMFVGYAMCTQLFGDACVPYVMFFWFASTCFTQTLAMWLIRRSGEAEGSRSWRQSLAFLRSPTVLGVFTGVTVVLLDVQPPAFLMSYLRYMNNVVSPLALILTGYIIYEMGWDKLMPLSARTGDLRGVLRRVRHRGTGAEHVHRAGVHAGGDADGGRRIIKKKRRAVRRPRRGGVHAGELRGDPGADAAIIMNS